MWSRTRSGSVLKSSSGVWPSSHAFERDHHLSTRTPSPRIANRRPLRRFLSMFISRVFSIDRLLHPVIFPVLADSPDCTAATYKSVRPTSQIPTDTRESLILAPNILFDILSVLYQNIFHIGVSLVTKPLQNQIRKDNTSTEKANCIKDFTVHNAPFDKFVELSDHQQFLLGLSSIQSHS